MTTATPLSFLVGSRALSPAHVVSVHILDDDSVWNEPIYRVSIPRLATVERLPTPSRSLAHPTNATCFG